MYLRIALIILLLTQTSSVLAQVPNTALVAEAAASRDRAAYRGLGEGETTLQAEFDVPDGFRRTDVAGNSFGQWLRGLPIERRTNVRAFDGRSLSSPAAAIVPVSVGRRNLQQCADSIIRLHAEWLLASGRRSELAYHFTSGDRVTYDRWLAGERFSVSGSKVKRRVGAVRAPGRATLTDWLELVFMYAGTRSLWRDSKGVEIGEVRAGDFFVEAGSPGHAVLVLDVASHPDGRRVALLGQGFMPAQDFHVLKDSRAIDGVWFVLPQAPEDVLDTPSWSPFSPEHARRFQAE